MFCSMDLQAGSNSRSYNYLAASALKDGKTILKDMLTGEEISFTADVIVNASGAWTDITNEGLGI